MNSLLNLSIATAGFTTIGGMVWGCYELLKNEPREIKDLIKIKKRIPLNKEGDVEAWKQSWLNYVKAHTKTVKVEEASSGTSESPRHSQPTTREVIDDIDIWKLSDWSEKKNNTSTVPNSFKEKCQEKYYGSESGIWTSEYKNFENYCTKLDDTED